jgi:membrane protease YdiL (CAAX protease family)
MQIIPSEKIHLRLKAALEVSLCASIFFGYVWCAYPKPLSWVHVTILIVLLCLFIYSKQSRGETWRDLGFRLDNWAPVFKKLLLITLPVITLLSVIWSQVFSINIIFYRQTDFWLKFATYPLWALIQQYIALAFFFRRLREIFSHHYLAAIFLSATLFSLAHLPNIPLVIYSFFGGLLWAWVYHKYNNLVIIIIFHAVIGTFLSTVLMMNLSVGPMTDMFRLTKTTPVYYAVDTVNEKSASSKYWPIEIKKSNGKITIKGWVAGKYSTVESVSVVMGGNEFSGKYGIKRKDVALAFNNPEYENSGFTVTIPISDIRPGNYYLKLKIKLKGIRYPHYPLKKIRIKIES